MRRNRIPYFSGCRKCFQQHQQKGSVFKIQWYFVSTYVLNGYGVPASRSSLRKLLSHEGRTQGDPLQMAIYSIWTTSLLNLLINLFDRKYATTVVFADDLTSSGKMKKLRKGWELLSSNDPLFGCYPQSHNSWIIVK